MMDDAKARGWKILTFGMGRGGVVGLDELLNYYPQVDGVILDGPGENHYELAFHHGGELLELRPGEDRVFSAMGADLDRMQRGIDHLKQSFRRLTPRRVRYLAQGGLFSVLNLIDLDEDGLYWLRMRQQKSLRAWADAREVVDQASRKIELGAIPRTAAVSGLTGQDYERAASPGAKIRADTGPRGPRSRTPLMGTAKSPIADEGGWAQAWGVREAFHSSRALRISSLGG